MATEDGDGVQRAEKVTLKRKLTGPPRLLLGKTRTRTRSRTRTRTRTRSAGDDRPEARTNKDKMENTGGDESSLTSCDSIVGSCRGRRAAAGDDITNRKVNRRRWWRRFCNRKQKKDVEESGGSGPPEGAPQETDGASPHDSNTEEENAATVRKGKRRLNVSTWPMFKRLLTSSDARRTHNQTTEFAALDEPSMTFRKKLRKVFNKGGKRRCSGVPLEDTEDVAKREEPPRSPAEPGGFHEVTVGSPEAVAAEVQLTEERAAAERPDRTATEQPVCDADVTEEDWTGAAGGSETTQPEGPVVGGPTSSQDAAELHREEAPEATSQHLRPSTNGPSVRIELVPPDDDEEDDDECWAASSSSVNQNHLLLGFDHSERQLVQAARSLVRAAMNAAVDQLTREQQSESDCVHREPQGCRDHA